jgi:hypothetical protein
MCPGPRRGQQIRIVLPKSDRADIHLPNDGEAGLVQCEYPNLRQLCDLTDTQDQPRVRYQCRKINPPEYITESAHLAHMISQINV